METSPFKEKYLAGQVLLVDKPLEWTSFDVVKKIRGILRIKKIGHAGTLDPLATGLLILCTGKMTKQIESFQGAEKEYTGTLVLGKTTPSLDLETEFDSDVPTEHLAATDVEVVRERFLGSQEQIPPHYSAIRVDGKRAYKDAHKGKVVEMKPRHVDITELEFTRIEIPEVDFRVVCSKGTYIRALARDIGEAVGVGAHLSALRRTRIGEQRIEDAQPLTDWVTQLKEEHANTRG